MLDTEDGIETSVKDMPKKAYSSMDVTLPGIEFWQPAISLLLLVSMMALQPPRES